jgi:hypothetical protein
MLGHDWRMNNDGTHDCLTNTHPANNGMGCGERNEACAPHGTPGQVCIKCGYVTPGCNHVNRRLPQICITCDDCGETGLPVTCTPAARCDHCRDDNNGCEHIRNMLVNCRHCTECDARNLGRHCPPSPPGGTVGPWCPVCEVPVEDTDGGRVRPLGRDNRPHFPTIPRIPGGGNVGEQNPVLTTPCANPLRASNPSCSSAAGVCHSCGYCRSCEWVFFGVIHCQRCQWGTDCIAALRGRAETDGRQAIRWCNSSQGGTRIHQCTACCVAVGGHCTSLDDASFAHGDVQTRPVPCSFECGRESVCLANCTHCPVDVCARCSWRGFGIIVCRGCSRTTDCISASGDTWNYTNHRCSRGTCQAGA